MFTLYHTLGSILDSGICHTRSNGELIRQLRKEDADFTFRVNRKIGPDDYYFFIIEYEKGDIIKIENFMGKDWYQTLNGVTSEEVASYDYFINLICNKLLNRNEPWPKNLDNLLKEILPLVFKNMSVASQYTQRHLYATEYSWIVNHLGKTLNQYVEQSDIDEYVHAMISCYELSAVEELLKEKDVKISEENASDFEKAKRDLAETIEIAKKMIEERKIDSVFYEDFSHYPRISIYAENTPCGKIHILITDSVLHGLEVQLNLNYTVESLQTTIDITEECKDVVKPLYTP